MLRLPVIFVSLFLIAISAFPGVLYAASGKKFEGAALDKYVRSCDSGSTPVLAMDKKGRWGASFHSNLAQAKQLAVSECSSVSFKPWTCKVVDVGCESDLFGQKSSSQAAKSLDESGKVKEADSTRTAETSRFACLENLEILQSEGRSPADCRDQGGTPFVANSYAEAERVEREWRSAQGIEFSPLIRIPASDELGTCAAPEVSESNDWELLKNTLKGSGDGSNKPNQARIIFEGDCWPAGQWAIDGRSLGHLSGNLLVPKKERIVVQIVSEGVIVFEHLFGKPRGEIVISGRKSKADKHLIGLRQERDKQASERREEIRQAAIRAEEERKAKEKKRREDQRKYFTHNARTIPLDELVDYLSAQTSSSGSSWYKSLLGVWFERALNTQILNRNRIPFDALRVINREARLKNIPLPLTALIPNQLIRPQSEAWRVVLAHHESMDLKELEIYKGVPILIQDKNLKWFFDRTVRKADYQKVLNSYAERTVLAKLSAGLHPKKAIRQFTVSSEARGIPLSMIDKDLVNMRALVPDDEVGDKRPPFTVLHKMDKINWVGEVENLLEPSLLESQSYPFLLFKVGLIDLDRDVLGQQSIGSKYVAGYQERQNPEYVKAYREAQKAYQRLMNASNRPNPEYYKAQQDYRSAQQWAIEAQNSLDYCDFQTGTWVVLACIGAATAAVATAQSNLNKAQKNLQSTSPLLPTWSEERAYAKAEEILNSTPQTVSVPVYQPYQFRKVELRIKKTAEVDDFTLIDEYKPIRHGRTTVNKRKDFTIVYNLHEADPDRNKHLSGASTEKEVETFSAEPLYLSYEDIFEAGDQRESLDNLASTAELEKYLSMTRARLPADKKLSFDTEAEFIRDPRLESVVIVHHPGGGLGSGFFVEENLVLTNYHVIEGATFVDIETLDGTKKLSKVVSHDIRLDLALVKVDFKGTPVKFSGGHVALGDEVQAIGHPDGLSYTLTQGVLSSIRRLPSMFDPGGPPVLFVQTDVAINPGNSGGPLFVDSGVIAVNTWKLAKIELEGLAFSVHASEVVHFLEEFRSRDK